VGPLVCQLDVLLPWCEVHTRMDRVRSRRRRCVCEYVFVCVCICVCVCVFVCGRVFVCGGVFVCVCICVYVWVLYDRLLMGDWLEIWRPLCDPEGLACPTSPLFVLNGKAVSKWSRVLSVLWEQTYDRTMTATILRYWKATKVALCAKSEEERRQVLEADW
jgi:hypothetical protein